MSSASCDTDRTLHLRVVSHQMSFCVPSKRIRTAQDLELFGRTVAFRALVEFLHTLNQAATGKRKSQAKAPSQRVQSVLSALDELEGWIEAHPPVDQSSRFGNKAYRDWYADMSDNASRMMEELLPPEMQEAATELVAYWCDSFGNEVRIDYGTGHETNFIAWMCALYRLGFFSTEDREALVFYVFDRYLSLMRKLQITYMLEPAGSHGVWGLDDYQFLPFMFGSAQLIDDPDTTPSSIHDKQVVKDLAEENFYMSCIDFINQNKSGPFGEHSPMLNDISAVPTWRKINSGMMKMYLAEVLNKLPVIQHFLFGALLPFEVSETAVEGMDTDSAKT